MTLTTLVNATGGRWPFSGAAVIIAGSLVWLLWRSLNPFPARASRMTATVRATPAAQPHSHTRHIMLTASASTGSNVGPTGVTGYDTVGPESIRTAVDMFYQRVTDDPDLSGYFTRVDLARVRRHQALFLGQLWGGPHHFDLEQLASVHRDLHITRAHYWRVVGHLMDVLTELDVPDWLCMFTLGALYDVSPLIIANPGAEADRDAGECDCPEFKPYGDGHCAECGGTPRLRTVKNDRPPVEPDGTPAADEVQAGPDESDSAIRPSGAVRSHYLGGPGFNSPGTSGLTGGGTC